MSRVRRQPIALVTAVTLATGAVLVTSVAVSLFASSRVEWNGGCGDDGREYCRMAQGLEAQRPWSRRFLLPSTLHVLGVGKGHVVEAFLVADILALVFVAAATAVLTWRLACMLGAERSRARVAAALSGVVTSLFPFAFHWTLFYPVLVDDLSLAFAVAWFLLTTSSVRGLRWAAVVPAGLAVLTRESWLPVVACGVIAQVAVERRRENVALGAATLAVIAACGAWAFSEGFPNPSTEHVLPTRRLSPALVRILLRIQGAHVARALLTRAASAAPPRKLSVMGTLWRAGPRPQLLVSGSR
jgi:hypothetical protein